MEKCVVFSLAISMACTKTITEARFFGDYDSMGSSGLHYQTMSFEDNFATHSSHLDPFGGTGGPLQNVRMGNFGGISGRFRSVTGRFRRGRGGKHDKINKIDKSTKYDTHSNNKKGDEAPTESIPEMDKTESALLHARDEKKKIKEAQRIFIDRLSLTTFQHLRSDAKRESKSLQGNPWAMQKGKNENEDGNENENEIAEEEAQE